LPESPYFGFTEAFADFIDCRSTHDNLLGHNDKFKSDENKMENLYQELKAYINNAEKVEEEELDHIIDEINSQNFSLVADGVDIGYRQGLNEGLKLFLYILMIDK
jgi:hypothetical protein